MPTMLGAFRRLILAPSLRDVTFAERGFPATPTDTTATLEAVPQAVVAGFEWGIDGGDLWQLARRLDMVDPELRGFAYEGATMACTIRDATGGHRTRDLLEGPGQPHLLLSYIGVGFAMARLPRPLWKKILPTLAPSLFHPTMSWLCVDGYGFDLAYFHTRRWVDEQRVPEPYPWLGCPEYFPRAVDHGIGRALWFIHGGAPDAVAKAVAAFGEPRRADLWAGVGLAATFAGGCGAEGLRALRDEAGEHADHLGLGAVFAATARVAATHVPEHTEESTEALAGLSAEAAVGLAATARPDPEATGPEPHYEMWRSNIRAALRARARQPAD